jgi:uncharacterized delta-60 repeat protein
MRAKQLIFQLVSCLGVLSLGSACFTASVVGAISGTDPSITFPSAALTSSGSHTFSIEGGRAPFTLSASQGSFSGLVYTPPTLSNPTHEVLVTFTVTDVDGKTSSKEAWVYRSAKLDKTFASDGVREFSDGRGRITEILKDPSGLFWFLRQHTSHSAGVFAQLFDLGANSLTTLPGGSQSLLLDSAGAGHYEDYRITLHPTGGFVMGSDHAGSGSGNIVLHKVTAQGALDTGFNGSGYVHHSNGSGGGMTVDSQGRIYAPAVVNYLGDQIGVVRLLADGSLDTSFAGTGFAVTSISGQGVANISAGDVWVAPDGYVYVTGHASNGGGWKGVFVRFEEDGDYDATFGNALILRSGDSAGRLDQITPLANGKFLLSYTQLGGSGLGSVIRRNADGSLDTTFGASGWSQTVSGMFPEVAEDSRGNLILCLQNDDFWVARLLPNGNRDTTFAEDAYFGSGDYAGAAATRCEAVNIDALDRIYFSGRAADASAKAYLYRLWN